MTWNQLSPYGKIGWKSAGDCVEHADMRVKSLLIFFNEGKQ